MIFAVIDCVESGVQVLRCIVSGKLDMRHKLTTYILRNPPDAPTDAVSKGKKKKGESTADDDDESPDETTSVS